MCPIGAELIAKNKGVGTAKREEGRSTREFTDSNVSAKCWKVFVEKPRPISLNEAGTSLCDVELLKVIDDI